jgi:hypothetical protein
VSRLADATDRRLLGIYRFHVPVYITLDVELAALFLKDLNAALRVRLNSIQELVVLFVHARLGMPARTQRLLGLLDADRLRKL